SAPTAFVDQRRERRLDQSTTTAMLEWNANRDRHRRPAKRRVDLIGQIGERVGERIVNRDSNRQRCRDVGQLTIPRVAVDQAQIAIEYGDGEGDCFEESLESQTRDSDTGE